MDRLFVYADFNWLEKPVLLGELGYESIRGSQSYSFRYSDEWLKKYAGILLSDDIRNYPGMQYTQPGKEIFGCFSDSLPDRWGRTLMKRREQTLAQAEGRPARTLTSFDMIMGIEDESRIGGFRYAETEGGGFINVSERMSVPPVVSLRELIAASHAIEEAEEKGELPDAKWLRQLHDPGTSLGGSYVRPRRLNSAVHTSEDYFIHHSEAESIIRGVTDALKGWQTTAKRLGLPERDISLFARRFITE